MVKPHLVNCCGLSKKICRRQKDISRRNRFQVEPPLMLALEQFSAGMHLFFIIIHKGLKAQSATGRAPQSTIAREQVCLNEIRRCCHP
jgi:hypothetical protein